MHCRSLVPARYHSALSPAIAALRSLDPAARARLSRAVRVLPAHAGRALLARALLARAAHVPGTRAAVSLLTRAPAPAVARFFAVTVILLVLTFRECSDHILKVSKSTALSFHQAEVVMHVKMFLTVQPYKPPSCDT